MPKRDDTISLFSLSGETSKNQPLAARMRPRTLDEFTGQSHIIGPGQLLRRAIEADRIQSLIFYGPPGTGKTSLAQVIANQTKSKFESLNGVKAKVGDIRQIVDDAKNRLETTGQSTIVFIDEIHRFNTAQQDALLPDVEKSIIKLIGATTETPSFSVNAALVSRSQIYQLKPLSEADLVGLLKRTLMDSERGLGHLKISADEDALKHLATVSDGDARKALNALDLAANTTPSDADGTIHITLAVAGQSIQKKVVVYDTDGEQHFDALSAYQKSMRGGDPDAALYWLAKMIHAGEDPLIIARRLCVSASEDVGMANSMALVVAIAAWQAVERIGLPEVKHQLAHATVYIATSPKSSSTSVAIAAALNDVTSTRTQPMPDHLRDKHSPGVHKNGQGFNYKHPKDYPDNFVAQDYLGANKIFYNPTEQGAEKQVKELVENWRKQFQEVRRELGIPPITEKKTPSNECHICKHSQPYQNGEFLCVNSAVLKMVKPKELMVVPKDFGCLRFEPK